MAALYGYGAVMVALREVEMNGGKGQVMDLPLFDPLFSVLGPQAANHKLTGEVKVRTGSRSTNAAPRNVYQTKDGHWVCLSASTQGMAERVLVKIGRPELVKDPALRHQHRAGARTASSSTRIIGELHRRARSRREPEVSSTRPASPSARSTTSPRSCRTTTCWSARR